MQGIDPRTPVLVGIGIVDQREKDPTRAREPVELMINAARAAGASCGAPALLVDAGRIAVPQGLWRYSDPARLIARALGASRARTINAQIGILQQTLIGHACRRIAAGETEVELVAGGEARFRHLQAQIAGVEASETVFTEPPDEVLAPAAELVLEAEAHSGLGYMPVGYYALIESAFRAASGVGVDAHRDRIASMYSRFSEIAAANPHAWKRQRVEAAEIRDATPRNRMLAFPYTKLHNTSWNVDQAAALLLCSAARAEAHGVPRQCWVFPRASTESNHMLAVAQRAELQRSPGARIAGRRALGLAGMEVTDLDLVELYSCFPIAVEMFAAELGIDPARDLTVTGGMPFAGGPLNNYVLQATARMAQLLRSGAGRTGLVSSVSGYLTKQGIGIWSREPGGFGFEDVSAAVEADSPARRVAAAIDGQALIVGSTVMYHEERPLCAVALIDQADGSRALVNSSDAELMQRMQREEWCARRVEVAGGRLLGGR